jgi:hypothetical protein
MSESEVGVSVAVIRQKAGRLVRGVVLPLGVKVPVWISVARAMETVEGPYFKRLLQGCCAWSTHVPKVATRTIARNIRRSVIIETIYDGRGLKRKRIRTELITWKARFAQIESGPSRYEN